MSAMAKHQDVTLRIFLMFSAFLVALAGLNYYTYTNTRRVISLVVMIGCLVALVVWGLFYIFYFRKTGADS